MNKCKNEKTRVPEEMRERLLAAISAEIKGEFVQRHRINDESPSFPYRHRTLANRDSAGTGPKGAFNIGKYRVYLKSALIDMLREDLMR